MSKLIFSALILVPYAIWAMLVALFVVSGSRFDPFVLGFLCLWSILTVSEIPVSLRRVRKYNRSIDRMKRRDNE